MNSNAFTVGLLALVGIAACSASTTDGSASKSALEHDECTARADQAKVDAIAQCQADNTFDLDGCKDAAWRAFTDYEALVKQAADAVMQRYSEIGDQSENAVAACQDAVHNMSCGELVGTFANKTNDADYIQKQCSVLRNKELSKCVSDADGYLKDKVKSDPALYAALGQLKDITSSEQDRVGTLVDSVLACFKDAAGPAFKAANCDSNRYSVGKSAYRAAYNDCRQDCGDNEGSMCQPAGFDILCGDYRKGSEGGVAGIGSTTTCGCEATDLCNDYQNEVNRLKRASSSSVACLTGSGLKGSQVAFLNIDPSTNERSIVDICVAPQSPDTITGNGDH